MTLHTTTRIPVDDTYAAFVGKAVYVFAYYEWTIIYIIDYLFPGYVQEYSRGNPQTSGTVKDKLRSAISSLPANFQRASVSDLTAACDEFENLIIKRNALIHAHPATDNDGSQILNYQTKVTKPLPDMKWPKTEVESIIAAFDAAAVRAGVVLDKLRQ